MEPSTISDDLLAATLRQLGLPDPADTIQTILMKDGRFVGHKLRYDGGYALLRADNNTLELYSDQRKLLKTVTLDGEKGAAA
ncbi:MAG: hypothetical protein ABFC96_05010 [Thermoguttaceae bacterium]